MLSVIVAPESAQQIATAAPAPPHPPRLDRLDQRLLEVVREEAVVQIWWLLNKVGDEEAPGDRAMARQVRLALWDRLKRLMWHRLIWRHGRKAVGSSPPPVRPTQSRAPCRIRPAGVRKRRETVRQSLGAQAVSTKPCGNSEEFNPSAGPVGNEVVQNDLLDSHDDVAAQQIQTAANRDEPTAPTGKPAFPTCSESEKNEHPFEALENQPARCLSTTTAQQTPNTLSPEQISAAAKALAGRPRGKKRWTGWLNDRWRGYKDQQVILPNGEPAFLFGVLRQEAVVTMDKGRLLGNWPRGPLRWMVIPASEVRPYRNSAARLLGQQKAGVVERKSEAKARAARLNGLRPTRPGRRRGRRPRLIRLQLPENRGET